ncbi:Sec-independent protein translocase subunit TatA/TatB [Bremerella sp. T1]
MLHELGTSSTLLGFFGGMGMQEMAIIGVIAILLFGKNLPGVAKTFGKHYGDFKRGLSDIQSEFNNAKGRLGGVGDSDRRVCGKCGFWSKAYGQSDVVWELGWVGAGISWEWESWGGGGGLCVVCAVLWWGCGCEFVGWVEGGVLRWFREWGNGGGDGVGGGRVVGGGGEGR